MNKIIKKILWGSSGLYVSLAFLLADSSIAQAADGYAGVDVSHIAIKFTHKEADGKLVDGEVSTQIIRGRIGVVIMPESSTHLSLESHLGFGVSTETADIDGQSIDFELETVIGLYVRADILALDDLGLYGLIGITSAQSGARPDLTTVDDALPETENATSVGIGLTYVIGKETTLQFEVLQLIKREFEDGFDASAISLGVNFALK